MLQCEQDVGSIEPRGILLEAANLAEIKEQFPSRAVFEAEIQLLLRLESVVHLDDKRVVH